MDFTVEQEKVIAHMKKKEHLVVEAYAGTGKTSTILGAAKAVQGIGDFFIGCYNKAIATEIQRKLAEKRIQHGQASTLHSAGLQALRTVRGNLRVDDKKDWGLLQSHPEIDWKSRAHIAKLTGLMKQEMIDPEAIDDEKVEGIIDHFELEDDWPKGATGIVRHAKGLLKESARSEMIVDFNDMLWLPIIRDLEMPQYDFVFLDEAQDTNRTRRELITRMSKEGKFTAVGDHHQAIFGFTGASADAMDLIKAQMKAKTLSLTVSWRCGTEIIKRAQEIVPGIQAFPGAHAGQVRQVGMRDLDPVPGDVVLCRLNKPLIELAFRLLREKKPVRIEGRDIAQGLEKLILRVSQKLDSIETLIRNLAQHLEIIGPKLEAAGKFEKLGILRDRIETIEVLAEGSEVRDVQGLLGFMYSLFQDSDGTFRQVILLSTVHKAKGKEWDRVWILGRNEHMPMKWATAPWELEQENNLIYVATTRAKHELIEVD